MVFLSYWDEVIPFSLASCGHKQAQSGKFSPDLIFLIDSCFPILSQDHLASVTSQRASWDFSIRKWIKWSQKSQVWILLGYLLVKGLCTYCQPHGVVTHGLTSQMGKLKVSHVLLPCIVELTHCRTRAQILSIFFFFFCRGLEITKVAN